MTHTHTGAFAALARYLDRHPARCVAHPGCRLPPGHDGPPMPAPIVRLPLNALTATEEDR